MAIRACVVAAAGLLVVTTAAAAPGNGRIAYLRDRSVYVSQADGSGEKAITTWPFYLDFGGTQPSWSPDGAHVAYLAQILSPGILDVVPAVAAPDGSGSRQLASHGAFRVVCWLDSSTLVAVNTVGVSTDIYAFGLDGSTQRLTADGGTKFLSPQACAPDGSAVAYSKQQPDYTLQATVVRRDGSPPTVLTPAKASDDAPSWSPAGDQLAFTRFDPAPGVYVSEPTGDGTRRVTPLSSETIRWSPDATELLFTSFQVDTSHCSKYGCPRTTQIRTLRPDGSNDRVLAESGESEGWSPDGQRVVFSIGLRSLLMNPDGSCKTLLPPNVPPSFAWQPDNAQPPAAELTCADLSVSADTQQLDLPLNGTANYTLTVTNKGNRPASAVSLDQPTDEGVKLTSVEPTQGSCSIDAGIHCSLGVLDVGASARVVVDIAVPGPLTTVLSAQVSAPEADGYPFDNLAHVQLTGFDCTILGTPGPDTLYGTPRGDRICGRGGNDTIYGNAGNDVIFGNDGQDTIYGGRGRDILDGGGGNDVILARDGERDAIDGGPEADTAVVDRSDIVIYCRTVYRPAKPRAHHAKKRPKLKRHARAPR